MNEDIIKGLSLDEALFQVMHDLPNLSEQEVNEAVEVLKKHHHIPEEEIDNIWFMFKQSQKYFETHGEKVVFMSYMTPEERASYDEEHSDISKHGILYALMGRELFSNLGKKYAKEIIEYDMLNLLAGFTSWDMERIFEDVKSLGLKEHKSCVQSDTYNLRDALNRSLQIAREDNPRCVKYIKGVDEIKVFIIRISPSFEDKESLLKNFRLVIRKFVGLTYGNDLYYSVTEDLSSLWGNSFELDIRCYY